MLATMIWGVLLAAGALALLLPPILLVLRSVRGRLGHRGGYSEPVPLALPPRPFVPTVLAVNVRTRPTAGEVGVEARSTEPAHEVRRAA
jgi:hypothetical protein